MKHTAANMADNDDRSVQLRVVVITFIPVVLLTLILRAYMRGRVMKALGWDDGLMILAFGFYILHVACVIGGSYYGLGRRIGFGTNFERIAVAVKYMWIAQLGYGVATVICKISVCMFLMRLTVKPSQIRLLWMLLGYTVIQGLYVIIADLVRCQPISYTWNQMTMDPRFTGTCITDTQNKIIAYVATGNLLIIDISLGIILPVMIVWGLQMPKATKIAVLSILCLTVSATVAIIVRIPYMDGYAESDALYAAVDMLTWAYIELSLGIIAGNLATLGPLFRTWFGLASSRGNSASTTTPKPKRSFRRPRGIHDLSFALSTLDGTVRSAYGPDTLKTATTVSQVDTQSHSASSRDANNSREQLTSTHRRASAASNEAFILGPGIYCEREVRASDVESAVTVVEERV
ncbi:putative integral membrane protein [Aspergillus mulundensis]|uniref:Rhodopsin domain-containing protein n=1 Tax=Aspergillus mulundensis TaxID=1810919 RepID=A0A3D8R9I2_9EURO|nr:hypothetical protein DSM5745_08035 [Aspergillus mulundensis]RDW70524.1 hypothetical protein DSM5745_08035 [Aspergillus mulundensis]